MPLDTVLVTGGTGTFGRAFVRHLLDHHHPKAIRVLSRDEAKQAEMRAEYDDPRLRFLVGDVRDTDRMMDACRGVDTVVHAAALKRVDTAEWDPIEAVRTNIEGTISVARACTERGIAKAVFLSTDKASEPNTLYGGTKFVAERLWLASNVYSAGTPTRFSATRYGNVIGSTGSVVPLWRAQSATGTLTVTDPAMSRFMMRPSDAVKLVMIALTHMRGGEVFVPKIGAATVASLAQAVAPGCTFRITGIRAGEKMHESLIGTDEARCAHDVGSCYVIEPSAVTWAERSPLTAPLVPAGWTYRSDTARTLTQDELRQMIE